MVNSPLSRPLYGGIETWRLRLETCFLLFQVSSLKSQSSKAPYKSPWVQHPLRVERFLQSLH